ncbi:hypothetical protein VCEC0051_003082B, partial [Vibrio cholerae O1 str. EC-0051]
RLI